MEEDEEEDDDDAGDEESRSRGQTRWERRGLTLQEEDGDSSMNVPIAIAYVSANRMA